MNGPRKTLQDRIEEEQKRQEESRAALADLKARARESRPQTRCPPQDHPGAAVQAHAKLNGRFREELRKAVLAAITRPQDRAVLPEFFPETLRQPLCRLRARKSRRATLPPAQLRHSEAKRGESEEGRVNPPKGGVIAEYAADCHSSIWQLRMSRAGWFVWFLCAGKCQRNRAGEEIFGPRRFLVPRRVDLRQNITP
jgi:hypothetical protein